MKTLIAGPWVGEFGWELFAWQAYVRSLSTSFDKTIIISRTKSEHLYSDFCNQFVPFDKVTGPADSFFMHNFDSKREALRIIKELQISLKGTTLLIPRRIGMPPYTHYNDVVRIGNFNLKPKYIKFGEKIESQFDYIFHIRNSKLREQDNWSMENWVELRNLFEDKKIACIGSGSQSGWIEGTEDLRDVSLSDLFGIISSSDCVFGPSSGPMHLASLCGCPHIVWGDQSKSLDRYSTTWNPLGTPVLFLGDKLYHPSPQDVFTEFKDWSLK